MNYFSMLIEWEHERYEAGSFSWTGWAKDSCEAECLARKVMASLYRQEVEDAWLEVAESNPCLVDDPGYFGGAIIECVEGAQIWSASEVANELEMLHRYGFGASPRKVSELLEMLRPKSKESPLSTEGA